MIYKFIFTCLSHIINIYEPSFVIFNNYNNHIKIDNHILRESGDYYKSSNNLFSINIDEGNYSLSRKPFLIKDGHARCVTNLLKDHLYQPYKSENIYNLTLNLERDKNIIISVSHITKCTNLNYPYFTIKINDQVIYGETTSTFYYYHELFLEKGYYTIVLDINNRNTYCCHCPSYKTGYEMGSHFCIYKNLEWEKNPPAIRTEYETITMKNSLKYSDFIFY